MSSERKPAKTSAPAELEPLSKSTMSDLVRRLKKSRMQSPSKMPCAVINFARPLVDGEDPPYPTDADSERVIRLVRDVLASYGYFIEGVALTNLTVRRRGGGKYMALQAIITCRYEESVQ